MEQPETRYAQTRDGLSIAYRVVGEGPKDVVFLSELACVDVMWEDPVFAHSLDRLARIGRLVCFDPRGLGASDPVPLGALPTIETRCEDFAAVLDTVGSSRATLIGLGLGGGPLVMFFAATYPDRTDALVLINTAARALRADDYPLGSRAEQVWKNVDAAKAWWGSGAFSTLTASRAADDSFRRWHGRYERLTMSPTTWRALVKWTLLLDVREVLPIIRVPTLVLHSEGNVTFPPDLARYVADNIPGARLVVLPGAEVTLYGETSNEFLDHIEEFVTGARPEREPDRVLATVLFTDIVSSTEQATRLGDRKWTEVLNRHDELVSRELERHRGRKVNPTGDGILATFDGPARAVRCAQAICEGVSALGIEVRAGLHTGEVELRGDDIGGIAVHIGQRVSALAGPGEVLVSRTVTDLVAGSGLAFEERGEQELKGVPGRWAIYAVTN